MIIYMTAPCLTNVSEEIRAQLRQSQKPVIYRPESQVEEGQFLCTLPKPHKVQQ